VIFIKNLRGDINYFLMNHSELLSYSNAQVLISGDDREKPTKWHILEDVSDFTEKYSKKENYLHSIEPL